NIKCLMLIDTSTIPGASSGCYHVYYSSRTNDKLESIAKLNSIAASNTIRFIHQKAIPNGASKISIFSCNGSESFLTSSSLNDYTSSDGVFTDSNGSYTVNIESGKYHTMKIRRATKDLGDIYIDLTAITTESALDEIKNDSSKLSIATPSGFAHTLTISSGNSSQSSSANNDTSPISIDIATLSSEANKDTNLTPGTTTPLGTTSNPPSGFSYGASPFTFTQNTAITTQVPTISGTINSCTVSPALPSGLVLDSTTCSISGTPSVIQGSTSYTVTATNSNGSNNTTISIAVLEQVAAPAFSPTAGYYNTPQNISITSATAGASIYYTTDGSTPTNASTLYSSSIHIWFLSGKTIQAIATKSGMADSAVTTLSGLYSYLTLKTGETTVRASGDDGNIQSGVSKSYTGPTAHATYTSDYTTTDNTTGLVWKSCLQGHSGATCAAGSLLTMTYADASSGANGCNALNSQNSGNGYAGITTWRLPSIRELRTILDFNNYNPAINSSYFPGSTTSNDQWSSTENALSSSNAWYVKFNFGAGGTSVKSNTYAVRCVSGLVKTAASNFTDNGDGTVKDNSTGLVWQKCSNGQGTTDCSSGSASNSTWTAAISYCNSLSLASRSWRLPNLHELWSITNETTSTTPIINTTAFPSTDLASYWSSNTRQSTGSDGFGINYSNGAFTFFATTNAYKARCVSGP
ncbi:MAG: DUF1566 domain-containing protein, partial [Spirochaetota bacterium]